MPSHSAPCSFAGWRAQATAEGQRGAETLGKAQRRERLLETMIDLRKGTPVSPERAQEAAVTFAEQEAERPTTPVLPGRRGACRSWRG